MKSQRNRKYSLGDLIVALFDEANRVVSLPVERKVMVYAALKHLLRNKVHSTHRIALQAPYVFRGTGGNVWSDA